MQIVKYEQVEDKIVTIRHKHVIIRFTGAPKTGYYELIDNEPHVHIKH